MALRRTTRLAVACALVALAAATAAATASADAKHMFWGQGTGLAPDPNAIANDLIYHGGSAGAGAIGIQKAPAVYLVYWGPSGRTASPPPTPTGSSTRARRSRTTSTRSSPTLAAARIRASRRSTAAASRPARRAARRRADYITNPKHQLKGVWTDPTPVPADIVTLGLAENLVDDPIAMEAMRASAHFAYDPDATYMILTPPGTICDRAAGLLRVPHADDKRRRRSATRTGSSTPSSRGRTPTGPRSAGVRLAQRERDEHSFGNGIFDSWSIVVGHEYAEAVTDPDNILAVQDGWNDAQTSENGDKCAWTNTQNITLGGHQFAVQPTGATRRSTRPDGCVFSR